MNREFKFKTYWKESVTGNIITDITEIRISERSFSAGSQQSNYRYLIGFCQFTGLSDKNGTPIFEGDIVKLDENPDAVKGTEFHNSEDVSHHQIFWDSERARFWDTRLEDGDSLAGHLDGDISFVIDGEIVGNIYQNPEFISKNQLRC